MNPFPGPLILGHRGSPREARENTLEALGKAMLAGADGVELDVQRSRDGVPVITHDDSLERVWELRHQVSRLDWAAIERLTGAGVPSFDQAAAWAAASGAWLNVEIKSSGVEKDVLWSIERTGIRDRVIISSFDAGIVRRVGEADPTIRRFFLTERWDAEGQAQFDRSGASGVCLRDDGAGARELEDLHRRGLPVIVWTVNEPPRVRELLLGGVAGIISDLPGMAAGERGRLGAG